MQQHDNMPDSLRQRLAEVFLTTAADVVSWRD